MKELRIVFHTGAVDANGKPILLHWTIKVTNAVNTTSATQIAELIDSLTQYTVQEAYIVTTQQVI